LNPKPYSYDYSKALEALRRLKKQKYKKYGINHIEPLSRVIKPFIASQGLNHEKNLKISL